MALVLGASFAWTIPGWTIPKSADPVPSEAPEPSVHSAPTTGNSQQDSLSPGDYITSPYTSVLRIVPENIDPGSVYTPNLSGSRMPIIQPKLHLHRKNAN